MCICVRNALNIRKPKGFNKWRGVIVVALYSKWSSLFQLIKDNGARIENLMKKFWKYMYRAVGKFICLLYTGYWSDLVAFILTRCTEQNNLAIDVFNFYVHVIYIF